jgi:hypothetical protein
MVIEPWAYRKILGVAALATTAPDAAARADNVTVTIEAFGLIGTWRSTAPRHRRFA